MNSFFAQTETSNIGALISWLPFVAVLVLIVAAIRQVRKNIGYMNAALKIAKENQDLLKESNALLKEISAKLNK